MKRLTDPKKEYQSDQSRCDLELQLGRYEDFVEEMIIANRLTLNELNKLKDQGLEKTVRFRELFGQKVWNQFVLKKLVRSHLIDEEDCE